MGPELLQHLDGMFSFALYDNKQDIFFCARDHVGITTLYYGTTTADDSVWFASEMKALNEDCDHRLQAFPPGHYYLGHGSSVDKDALVEYYHPAWFDDKAKGVPALSEEESRLSASAEEEMYTSIRSALEKSVQKRLMSEVPYGVLLSGGLDSSLIAAIAVRMAKAKVADEDEDIRCALGFFLSRK